MTETPDITMKVSKELLAQLGDWSEPVQVKIKQYGGEWTMIARRPSILVELTGDRAPMPWMRVVEVGGDGEAISMVTGRRMRIRLSVHDAAASETAEMGA